MAEKKIDGKVAKNGLTDKQRRFCDEYLCDMNATQAAIRAGYSKRTAYRTGCDNLKKPQIRAYIDQQMAEKDAELVATQNEVLQYLTSVMRGKSVAVEVVVEGTGEGTSEARVIEKEPSEMERIKAADQLAKCHGLYRDKEKLKIDLERLEIEKQRLELEKRKADADEPDREIKVVIGGYEEEWSE